MRSGIYIYLLSFAIAVYAVAPSRLHGCKEEYSKYSNIKDGLNRKPDGNESEHKEYTSRENAAMSKREELESQKDMEEKEEFKANVFQAIDGFNQPYLSVQDPGTKPMLLHEVRLCLNDDMARLRKPQAVIIEDEKVRI